MSSANDPVLVTSNLVKTFGSTTALAGLNLTVDEGEVHGFLGPNGSGKSTTIRIALGLMKATSGSVRVLGLDPWSEPVTTHRDIAYVPGDVSLWPSLTGGEAIDLLTNLRGGASADRRAQLIDEFELDPRKKARTYSKGNRQKVALIAAFARPAKLYILDEPSSGLDPVMETVLRRQIDRARAEGATVLLSSHILSEVERLCDRVTIIRAGVAVESGTLTDLRHLSRTSFRVGGVQPETFQSLGGVHNLRSEAGVVEFEVDSDSMAAVLAHVAMLKPASLTVEPASLESLFMRHYSSPTQ